MQNNLDTANIARAIAILKNILADRGADANPLFKFVREHLTDVNPTADVSCDEIWQIYDDQSAAGYLPPMRRAVFFRKLPAAMLAAFKVKRCTNLRRVTDSQPGKKGRVRGFQGVSRFVKPVLERPNL